MRFADIPGHQELKSTLTSSFERNHVAHAQLFHGDEGGAALPLAIAYATYILCENKNGEDACGVCASCQKMQRFVHPDVHFFYPKSSAKSDPGKEKVLQASWRSFLMKDAYGNLDNWVRFADIENKQVQISKDDARNIVKTVSMKSFEGNYKVVFLWYPEMMNGSAANAILKILEEPPAMTIYLLVSYNVERIIRTITSRTQLVKVVPFDEGDVEAYLIGKGEESSQAKKVARIAAGNVLTAQKLLDHSDDLEHEEFQEWMRACLRKDYTTLVKYSEDFSQAGRAKQHSKMSFALTLIRQAILAKGQASELLKGLGDEGPFIQKFSGAVSFDGLQGMVTKLNEMIYHLERNANPKMAHLNLSIRFSELLKT